MYGMGYYSGYEEPDEYEDAEEYEEPQQRQRNAPRSPGLRQYMKSQQAEIKALKKTVDEQKQMLQELMEGDSLSATGGQPGGRPQFLSDAEQMQYQQMLAQGTAYVAAPMGTQAEQIARIRAARTPAELTEYLRSQGNNAAAQNYEGMGY